VARINHTLLAYTHSVKRSFVWQSWNLLWVNVGGTWDKENEAHDRDKHPVSFRYRTRAELRALTSQIAVEVDGLADVQGYIDEVVDVTGDAVNETLTPGGEFIISGDKIKIAGDNAGVGLYFVSAADTTQRIKVTGRMAENGPAKLIGIIPALTTGAWKVQVGTQYAGSGTITLKAPRTRESKVAFTGA
jgi:hypothetical protein